MCRQGLKLLHRNFHGRRGEIDLVMRDGDTLVFVEVRYRRRCTHGRAVETVARHKQLRIIATAQYYMQRHRAWGMQARFDLFSLEGRIDKPDVDWIQDAFRPDA